MHFVPHIICPLAGLLALTIPAQADYPDSSTLAFPYGANGIKAPVTYPLSNGFPYIANNTPAWDALTLQAHGSISNAPAPPSLAEDDVESMKVIFLQEAFEAWYYTQILQNIANNVTGYEINDPSTRYDVMQKLIVMQGQEMWHTIQAGAIVKAFSSTLIEPCVYKAPVNDLQSAMSLATNVTGLVMATLQNVATRMGQNGDLATIGGVVSICGNEAEQQGYLRTTFGDYVPADGPYMTASTIEYAYSALMHNFVVSCPSTNVINIALYEPLTLVTTNIQAMDQTLEYSIEADSVAGLSMAYINQQNMPTVVPITNPTTKNGVTTFWAEYPYTANAMFGLSIAAMVNSTGPFTTASDAADHTQYGPALIYPN